jgi:hypothetical protein
LDKRGAGRTLQYFVKWKGYPDSDNTWENSKDLPSTMVKKFETSVKKAEIVHRSAESESEPEQEDKDDGDDDYSGKVKTPKKTSKKSKAASAPKRGKGGKVAKRGRPAKVVESPPAKKTPAKKSPAKKAKTPKKETTKKVPVIKDPPKPKVWILTDRRIIDNVVHYGVKHRVKPVPIYDFEDFQPIFDFEMEQAQKDEALMEPIRIVEKKGNKYLVEWKGNNNKNSWETKANLACAKLISDFDDREEEQYEDDDDIEYTIKKIIGKRKNGRIYEYQVVWSGCGEDTATWEPEDNLQNAKAMISNFDRAQKKELEAEKAKKRKARDAKSVSPKKSRK